MNKHAALTYMNKGKWVLDKDTDIKRRNNLQTGHGEYIVYYNDRINEFSGTYNLYNLPNHNNYVLIDNETNRRRILALVT